MEKKIIFYLAICLAFFLAFPEIVLSKPAKVARGAKEKRGRGEEVREEAKGRGAAGGPQTAKERGLRIGPRTETPVAAPRRLPPTGLPITKPTLPPTVGPRGRELKPPTRPLPPKIPPRVSIPTKPELPSVAIPPRPSLPPQVTTGLPPGEVRTTVSPAPKVALAQKSPVGQEPGTKAGPKAKPKKAGFFDFLKSFGQRKEKTPQVKGKPTSPKGGVAKR